MFDERDRKYFYDEFKNNGYEVGSYDDFKKDLNNKEDLNTVLRDQSKNSFLN